MSDIVREVQWAVILIQNIFISRSSDCPEKSHVLFFVQELYLEDKTIRLMRLFGLEKFSNQISQQTLFLAFLALLQISSILRCFCVCIEITIHHTPSSGHNTLICYAITPQSQSSITSPFQWFMIINRIGSSIQPSPLPVNPNHGGITTSVRMVNIVTLPWKQHFCETQILFSLWFVGHSSGSVCEY